MPVSLFCFAVRLALLRRALRHRMYCAAARHPLKARLSGAFQAFAGL
jgi:hypothetical protein